VSSVAAPAHALTHDEQAVLAPVQGVLDGIAKRDKAIIRAQLLPGGMATFVRKKEVHQVSYEAFLERPMPPDTTKLEERIYNPLIRVDDDIAVVWAAYDFFIDGKVDHCGTDIFTLVRHDGKWLVSGIFDNSRKTCPSRS